MIKTQTYTFEELFNGNYFHVPKFQRAFAWRKEHVNDFWDDITEAIEFNRKHFLGSLVLQAGENNYHYNIFDGQQRLTVVVSLISIIRNVLISFETKDIQLNNNIQSLINDTQKYLWNNQNRLFLLPHEQYQKIFKEYLRKPYSTLQDKRFRANDFLRNNVFKNLSQKMSKELERFTTLSDKYRFLNRLFHFVSDSIYFVVIYANNNYSETILFETLNYRGASLKVEDLLKSIVFAKADDQESLTDVEAIWKENLELIEKNRLSYTEFLKYYWSFRNSRVVEGNLYKTLKRDIETDNVNISEYMKEMNHYLKLYVRIAYPKKFSTWKNNEKIQNSLEALSLFKAKQCYPVLLSLFSFTEEKTDPEVRKLQQKLVSFLEKFFFRMLICNQKIPNDVVLLLIKSSKEIRLNPKIKIDLLIQELRTSMPDDKIFEQSFSTYVSPNKNTSFYILYKIELFLSGRAAPVTDNPKQVNVEHIMPQTLPEHGWKHVKKYQKVYLNRLGNLTLLSKSLNVTNGTFLQKKNKYYSKSSVKMTQQLNSYDKWRKKEMNDRQKELAKKALEIW